MKVLLVAPPYRPPNEGTLALATLRPILEAAGHEVTELHGSLYFPSQGATAVPPLFHWNSRFAFGRALARCGIDEYIELAIAHMVAELDPYAVLGPRESAWESCGMDETTMRDDLRDKLRKVDACIERMVERALALGRVDVACFSTMFTDQVPAAVAVARRLKAAWPETKIAFGGAVCLEMQADGLLTTFLEIDAACHGEGEPVIVPLIEALTGGAPLGQVLGISWREGMVVHHNPSPPLLRDLDVIPMPDYHAFVEDLAGSEWSHLSAELFFETSRGCWWGEKSLCSFCGLNAEGLAFRAKSPGRAHDEIRHLHQHYPTADYLRAADNILDFKYLKTVFPRLRDLATDPVRPLRMFYEVKSNMKPEQIEAMAAAGVVMVQPGIESFSDSVLKVMRKGCTALGQVQFVKWAQQSGVLMSYNVLIFNPGEDTPSYWEMLELLPYIEHLQPPMGISTMLLERFSPYHSQPEAFGITNMRPKRFFHDVFGADADERLAYEFDYDHPILTDTKHLAAVRALAAAIRRWQRSWRPDLAYYIDDGNRLMIVDSRDGGETSGTLTGLRARIFLFLDQNRTRQALAEAFPAVEATVLDALLLSWVHTRWICRVGDRHVAVLPRKGPTRQSARPATRPEPARVTLGLV